MPDLKDIDEYEEEWITNREKVRKPNPGKHFCSCDHAYGNDWKKCPVCGQRRGVKREKIHSH